MSSLRMTPVSLPVWLVALIGASTVSTSRISRVETDRGPVIGTRVTAVDPRFNQTIEYYAYKAIPFAQPPIGDLRFRPPQPPSNWSQPLENVIPEDRTCYQVGKLLENIVGDESEDCLYLNVFVPANLAGPAPVMVYVTGGGFIFGASNWYGPDFWMIHEIILVVINYRVGLFGFLTLGTPEAPGNAGLLDQLAALEWVQNNIASFGGDSSLVTLAGESAGSFSAFYHLASPRSRGLFRRIIGQSGMGGLSPGFHENSPQDAVRYGHEAAIEVGCLQLDPSSILACLREKEPFWLSAVDFAVGLSCQPVVDGEIARDPLLPQYPRTAFENGDYDRSVDLLLGSNLNEGLLVTQLFYVLPSLFTAYINNFDVMGPILLFMKKALEIKEEDRLLAREVLDYYTDGAQEITFEAHITNITDMLSDAIFWYGNHRFLEIHQNHEGTGRTYQYMNKHVNDDLQFSLIPNVHLPGVSHADELSLEFSPFLYEENKERSAADFEASKLVTTAWSNFIKTGDPGLGWQPVTRESWRYWSISLPEPVMELEPDYLRRMEFWEYIVSKMDTFKAL